LGAATSNLDALQKTVASAHEARARVEEELQAKTDEGRKLATLLDETRRNSEVLASAVRHEERKLEEIGDRLNMVRIPLIPIGN
jgi:predicted  nucleic acid-binding Zn-ribbon protein